MATRFAADGARVVIADVDTAALEAAAAGLRADGAEVEAVPTDVGDPEAVQRLADRTLERFGAVHVVCNNAGILVMGTVWEVDLAAWRNLMDVNFWGVVHGIQAFVPILLRQGQPGYVVNTASMAGVTALPSLAPYVTSKHAVVALSEVLDAELRAAGAPIGVSVLCPGMVATHLGRPDRSAPLPPAGPGVLSAADVAGKVVDAMRLGRLHVFTHPDAFDRVHERFEGVLGDARTV
jgi:NAD(P)-dependent dehydrogenase (short-subunit alcohol dehydrogenase family)